MAQPEINTLTLEEIIPFNVAAKSKDWADLYFQTIKNHNRHAVEYLKSLNDLFNQELITPSVYRELTEKGKNAVTEIFGDYPKPGSLLTDVYSNPVFYFIGATQHGRLESKYKISEMDAFVFGLSELILRSNNEEQDKRIIDFANKNLLHPLGPAALGAIHIVQEGIKQNYLLINPQDAPRGGCYLKYNILINAPVQEANLN